jgi:hypothetical protein
MMPAITEVACWAHCRRSIYDVWQSTKSTVAKAALDRIAQFYAIEDKARFAPPDERLAHRTAIIPLLDAFFTWAQTAERQLSARSELAEALRYIIKRRTALTRFATDARLEADNNIAENAIRCIALGRRNWLFAGSHSGGDRAAAMYSILQTAMYGAAVRCKRVSSICRVAVLHQCIRPPIGAYCAPGHHGNQRAYLLIKLQASSGPSRSPGFACAVKTDPPSRLILSQTSAGNWICGATSSPVPSQYSSFVRAIKGRSFAPACNSCGAPRAGAVKTGRAAATRRAWS